MRGEEWKSGRMARPRACWIQMTSAPEISRSDAAETRRSGGWGPLYFVGLQRLGGGHATDLQGVKATFLKISSQKI